MKIESKPPHDFYLALDATGYFEAEHDPEEIYRGGYARPLTLADRDVLAVVRWNEDPDQPVFAVDFPDQDPLTAEEEQDAQAQLRRILGADLDLRGLMEQASDDPVLGPMLLDYYGFKRIANANVYEDAVSDIIRTRISHRPTAKRMVQDVRRTWGSAFVWRGTTYYSYPRPAILAEVDPDQFREFGISRRKAEYVTGMAQQIVEGTLDLDALEQMEPLAFYERIQQVRGIGPSTAQTLMGYRNRPDAVFPSRRAKGKEKSHRRWFLPCYGVDPHTADDAIFDETIARWKGYEALAQRFLFYDWLMSEKERHHGEG